MHLIQPKGYIHIGPVKTGSTFLQRTVYENRHIFEKLGLGYPFTDRLTFERFANAEFLSDVHVDVQAIRTELQANHRFLLSEEGIFFRPWNLGHPAFNNIPKKIILYARRPAELIVSWAAENAKPYNAAIESLKGSKGPIRLEDGIRILADIYEKAIWQFISYSAGAEGRLNAELLIYSKEMVDSSEFLSRFLNSLDLNSSDVLMHPEFKMPGRVNEGHSRKFYDISFLLWKAMGQPSDMKVYNHPLVERLTASFPGGDNRYVLETISDDLIEYLTKRFAFWENFLSDRFLGGAPVFTSSYPDCFGVVRKPYEPIDEALFLSFLRKSAL